MLFPWSDPSLKLTGDHMANYHTHFAQGMADFPWHSFRPCSPTCYSWPGSPTIAPGDNCPGDIYPVDNCPWTNCPWTNCPVGQLSIQDNCPAGNCPRGQYIIIIVVVVIIVIIITGNKGRWDHVLIKDQVPLYTKGKRSIRHIHQWSVIYWFSIQSNRSLGAASMSHPYSTSNTTI